MIVAGDSEGEAASRAPGSTRPRRLLHISDMLLRISDMFYGSPIGSYAFAMPCPVSCYAVPVMSNVVVCNRCVRMSDIVLCACYATSSMDLRIPYAKPCAETCYMAAKARARRRIQIRRTCSQYLLYRKDCCSALILPCKQRSEYDMSRFQSHTTTASG